MKHLAKALLLAGPITFVLVLLINWIMSIALSLMMYALVATGLTVFLAHEERSGSKDITIRKD